MKILVRGIDDTSHAGQRQTVFYEWCKTQTQMFKLIKQALKDGLNTIIINRVNDDYNTD